MHRDGLTSPRAVADPTLIISQMLISDDRIDPHDEISNYCFMLAFISAAFNYEHSRSDFKRIVRLGDHRFSEAKLNL